MHPPHPTFPLRMTCMLACGSAARGPLFLTAPSPSLLSATPPLHSQPPPHPYPSPKPPSAALLPAFPAATTCPVPRMLAARTTASSSRWPAPSTPPSSGPRRASRCGEARRGLGCATAPAAAAGAPMPGARRPAWSGRSSRDAPLTPWEPRGPACRTTIAPSACRWLCRAGVPLLPHTVRQWQQLGPGKRKLRRPRRAGLRPRREG